MTAIAKVTLNGRITIPHEIRAALRVNPGDLLLWEAGEGGVAQVQRVQPLDEDYLRAIEDTLSEWSSPADEAAYREL